MMSHSMWQFVICERPNCYIWARNQVLPVPSSMCLSIVSISHLSVRASRQTWRLFDWASLNITWNLVPLWLDITRHHQMHIQVCILDISKFGYVSIDLKTTFATFSSTEKGSVRNQVHPSGHRCNRATAADQGHRMEPHRLSSYCNFTWVSDADSTCCDQASLANLYFSFDFEFHERIKIYFICLFRVLFYFIWFWARLFIWALRKRRVETPTRDIWWQRWDLLLQWVPSDRTQVLKRLFSILASNCRISNLAV